MLITRTVSFLVNSCLGPQVFDEEVDEKIGKALNSLSHLGKLIQISLCRHINAGVWDPY